MESYEDVPYPGSPFAQTHPDRLATHALLFGMEPASPQRCRLLELGCGDGENLLPMALSAPHSQFVGIDLAESAVARARETACALGLTNLTLHAGDLRDVSAEWGRFDYVIAHGVWSWVPDAVRARMLGICRDQLAPHGVAYISYDVLPGGHLRQMLRDTMLYHARHASGDRARIAAARELLALLASEEGPSTPYHDVLRAEAKTLGGRSDEVLFHDDLCESHALLYFHEFVAHAQGQRLQYLAEAELVAMHEGRLPAALREALPRIAPTRIEREQYLDFAQGRRFRQTLLCRADVTLSDAPRAEVVQRLFARADGVCDASEDALLSDQPVRFRMGASGDVEVWHPVAKLALAELGAASPAPRSTPDLLERVRSRRGRREPADLNVLCETLLALYAADQVALHVSDASFTTQIGPRPRASALARLQIQRGPLVTTLAHQRVRIEDELGRRLLALLDGTRDSAAIVEALAQGDPRLREVLGASLRESLEGLARLALLEA